MRRLFVKRLLVRTLFFRRRYCLMTTVIVLSCIMAPFAVRMMTVAASAETASVGSILANNDAIAFYGSDVDYLRREADLLHSEIDYSALDLTEASCTVTVSGSRRNLLDSHGVINYGQDKVIVNANDLLHLANQIDILENYYASTVYRALNTIGTYLDTTGVVYHEPRAADNLVLTGFKQLADGILQSQSVTHLESSPVTPENITAGAAAWVDGQCIIGNGADNDRAYWRGMEDGEAENREDVDIRYKLHVHTGNSGVDPIPDGHVCYATNDPGGCYRSIGHTHNVLGVKCRISAPCNGTMVSQGSVQTSDGAWHTTYKCDRCETISTDSGTCKKIKNTYTCGSDPVHNTWKVNCGKKAGQTESAEVIIRRSRDAGE